MKIRRSKADDLFSLYIRMRDNWTCQRCGKRDERRGPAIQCAHIFSRRHWATRHSPDNAIALCFQCHAYFTGNPLVFARWCREKFGEAAMAKLDLRAHSIAKKSRHDESLRVTALREMISRLEAA